MSKRKTEAASLGHKRPPPTSIADGQRGASKRIKHKLLGKAAKSTSKARALSLMYLSGTERVQRAVALFKAGKSYTRGCSDFVCDVLQISYEQAKDLMGSDDPSKSIGKWPSYDISNLRPGDVCGWLLADASGDITADHVTIYVANPSDLPDALFIDVPGENKTPRKLKNGYGRSQEVWKSASV